MWDGKRATFHAYSEAIEGHLLQAGAGYMVNKKFHEQYTEVGPSFIYTGTFLETYHVSEQQAEFDKTYFYGMLKSTNRSGGEIQQEIPWWDSQLH